MKHFNITTLGLLGSALVSSSAFAAGLDRATFNPALMFEKGTYAEFSIGSTRPSVAPSVPAVAPVRINVAPKFTTTQVGYKQDIGDKLSVGLMANTNPMGVHITYAGLGNPTLADLGTNSLTFLGKYNISDSFSVYAGAQHTKTSGDANLTALGVPEPLSVSGSGTGYIVGAAYEIPKIAFRASLSYESGAELDPSVTGASGFDYGVGQINTPEAYTLNIQSGVAEDTLVFASIRYADWEGAQVALPALLGSTQLSTFENTAAINLGVARRIDENFSVLASLSYEKAGNPIVSPLAPTNGIKGISVGGRYTNDNGVSTSLGLSYSKRGDATTTTGIPFSNNRVITMGMKISKSF